MRKNENNGENSHDYHAVLTEAFIKATKMMELDNDRMAHLLELDPVTVDHLFKGDTLLNKNGRTGKRALQFIELYRSGLSVTGSAEDLRYWLHTSNRHLNGRPIDLIMTESGLKTVLNYLQRLKSK